MNLDTDLNNPWILSLGIILISLCFTVVARIVLRFVVIPFTRKTQSDFDDIVILAIKKMLNYTVPLVGVMLALKPLSLNTLIPRHILFSILAFLKKIFRPFT